MRVLLFGAIQALKPLARREGCRARARKLRDAPIADLAVLGAVYLHSPPLGQGHHENGRHHIDGARRLFYIFDLFCAVQDGARHKDRPLLGNFSVTVGAFHADGITRLGWHKGSPSTLYLLLRIQLSVRE